jgi:hypothetical protein
MRQIGLRLLEMQHDEPAVRQIKVNTLKENLRTIMLLMIRPFILLIVFCMLWVGHTWKQILFYRLKK